MSCEGTQYAFVVRLASHLFPSDKAEIKMNPEHGVSRELLL